MRAYISSRFMRLAGLHDHAGDLPLKGAHLWQGRKHMNYRNFILTNCISVSCCFAAVASAQQSSANGPVAVIQGQVTKPHDILGSLRTWTCKQNEGDSKEILEGRAIGNFKAMASAMSGMKSSYTKRVDAIGNIKCEIRPAARAAASGCGEALFCEGNELHWK